MNKIEQTLKSNQEKNELLRGLIRAILLKDQITEKEKDLLSRRATELGLDAEEVIVKFDALLSCKLRAGKKSLFRRKPNYKHYFELLVSAKIQNSTKHLSTMPTNKYCNIFFRKVSPLIK